MALDYVSTSKAILEAVGGKENVASATHCMTRLRLVLKDEGKANDEKVQSIKGVKSVIKQGGQYQVVIGNEVSSLYKEFAKQGNFSEDSNEEVKAEGNPLQRLFGFIAACMTPLLPAMLGTGMIKVVLTICTTFFGLSTESSSYILVYNMADSFFYFLPIFLSFTIAKKMKGNPSLFMVIGAMMCVPPIVSLMGVETDMTFLGMPAVSLFGLPVIQATYTSSVLPILLMAPVMKWAEDFADKVSPAVVKSFLKPMIFLIICTPVAFCVLGPIGTVIGNLLAGVFSAAYGAAPWLTVAILSAAMPFIVMTGMHYALIPLFTMNLATLGYDVIILVTMFCSNIAQGGAAFGVAAKTKDVDTRSEGLACGISAALAGITEPAMYGINLRYGTPMIGAVIAAGISGLFCGLTNVRGYTMGGSPSFMSVITFIGGDDPMHGLIFGLIGGVISIVIAFVVTFIIFSDEKAGIKVNAEAGPADAAVEEAIEEKKALVEKIDVVAPVEGEVVDLSEVPDDVFASLALGDGVAIIPKSGEVHAPISGTISAAMGHAVGITGDNGVEVLVHFGLDTVNLNGAPFDWKVKEGDKVKVGQLLYVADIPAIEAAGLKTYTPVLITNTDDYVSVLGNAAKNVKVGDQLITIV